MATGDIVKFGMLSSNGNTYRQKSTIEAYNNGYRGINYTNFNFVDALDEDDKWTWIEANIDIGKIYICTSILKAGSYNQLQNVLNKNMNIGGKTYQLILLTREQIEEQVPISIARQIDFADNSGQAVEAPLQGSMFNILVKQGQSVKKGDVLAVLEAMKMENEIIAPIDGTVSAIHVEKGQNVNLGDTILEIA